MSGPLPSLDPTGVRARRAQPARLRPTWGDAQSRSPSLAACAQVPAADISQRSKISENVYPPTLNLNEPPIPDAVVAQSSQSLPSWQFQAKMRLGANPWKQLLVRGFGGQHRGKEVSNACRERKECLDCGDFCGYCASKWRQMASTPAVDKDSSTVRKRLITSS